MKLRMDDYSDPEKHELCKNADVYLDGYLQICVIEADSDEGYVVRYKTLESGELNYENGEIVPERVEGKVEIKDRRESQGV